jgi:hypothetical protein
MRALHAHIDGQDTYCKTLPRMSTEVTPDDLLVMVSDHVLDPDHDHHLSIFDIWRQLMHRDMILQRFA